MLVGDRKEVSENKIRKVLSKNESHVSYNLRCLEKARIRR